MMIYQILMAVLGWAKACPAERSWCMGQGNGINPGCPLASVGAALAAITADSRLKPLLQLRNLGKFGQWTIWDQSWAQREAHYDIAYMMR
jgi:hypothetical protein